MNPFLIIVVVKYRIYYKDNYWFASGGTETGLDISIVGGAAQPSFLHKALDIYLKHFKKTNNTTNKIISHILLAEARR